MIIINGEEFIQTDKFDTQQKLVYPNKRCETMMSWCKLKRLTCKVKCYCDNPICRFYNSELNEFPFINVPYVKEKDWVECEIGYYNIREKKAHLDNIEVENIIIENIKIRKESIQHESFGYRYGRNDLELIYDYEISIIVFSKDKQSSIKRKVYARDKIRKESSTIIEKKVSSILCLFRNTIPLINKYVRQSLPIKYININYIQKTLPDKNCYYVDKNREYCLFDAMDILYSMEIDREKKIIQFGKGKEMLINYYIMKLINYTLSINLIYDVGTKTIYSEISDDLLLKTYEEIACVLYLNIIKNFDKEIANQFYLMEMPKEDTNNRYPMNKIETIKPDKTLLDSFNFISTLEAFHFIDGVTRVGRDDVEWTEKSFIFHAKNGFKPSNDLIIGINNILEIELKLSETHNNSKECIYSYREVYDKDYIAGLARSKEDLDSEELRKKSFYRLCIYLMDKNNI